MASGQGQVVLPRLHRDETVREIGGEQVSTYRHSADADGASPERSASHKYGTLASKGSTGDTAKAGPLDNRYEPKDTKNTKYMESGEQERQRARPARGHSE